GWPVARASAADAETKTDKDEKKYGGWGKKGTGGGGKPTGEGKTFKELFDELKKGEAIVLLNEEIYFPKDAAEPAIATNASNLTLDGGGHTLYGDNMPAGDPNFKEGRGTNHMLTFHGGKNFIVKNLRMRNCEGGGHLCFYKGASDIVIDHVSLTGACNKA